ncbi:MAG: murein biosynthesis integral membrane protein MurJ [Athalassotoga sp.]|uniref:murein biosynthesis integral membrane protein MurJ n=1 Tax=Athalassotoga sp. TaxID=2022597 RepID=UPI003CFE64A8
MSLKRRIGSLIHSRQNMSQAILLITILTLVSKTMGFVRDIFIAYFFGTGSVMDAYLASQSPLGLINGIITGTIVAAFIPLFVRVIKSKNEEEAKHFSATIFYSTTLMLAAAVVLIAIFAPEVTHLFFPGFGKADHDMTVNFIRWMSFATVIGAMLSFVNGLLQSEKKFLAYPLVGLSFDFIVIGTLFATKHLGAVSLALAWTLPPTFIFIVLGFAERKYLNPFKIKRKIPETRDLYKMIWPLFFSSALGMLNTIVDRTFASTLETGAISSLSYANRVTSAANGVLGTPVTQVTYPSVASRAAENDIRGLTITTKRAMKLLAFFLIPVTFALFPLAKQVITLIFQRGNFTVESTMLTYPPLIAFSLSLFTSSLGAVLVQIYYSFKNTRTPMIFGMIGLGINIGLNFLFISHLKQTGLALSTSISSIYFVIVMLISLRVKFKVWFFDLYYFIKVIIASILMDAVIYLILFLLRGKIRDFAAIFAGIAVYFLISWLIKTLPNRFWRFLKFKKSPEENEKL